MPPAFPLTPEILDVLDGFDLEAEALIATTIMGTLLRVRQKNGEPAVLKCLSETGKRAEETAATLLSAFGPEAAANLIASSKEAIVMEYCSGPSLDRHDAGCHDDIALPILSDVLRRLHSPKAKVPQGLPTLAERCMALERGLALTQDREIADFLTLARIFSSELIETSHDCCLLHGDLHHENVMLTRREGKDHWVIIDPQGLIGDPAYEVANIFSNPVTYPELVLDPARPDRIANHFAKELGYDRNRILHWGFVHTCISISWHLEDKTDHSHRIQVARLILNKI